MNVKQAEELAEKALRIIDSGSEYEYVGKGTSIVAGRDNHGYYVTDNGEEASGLNRNAAKQIIVENLTA